MVEASTSSPLTLLVPESIESEIQRHISERAAEAIKALEEARRKAPFLTKWVQWPQKLDEPSLRYRLTQLAQEQYDTFKQKFKVIPLDYSQVNLAEIMVWYNQGRAPFGTGRKRKEFPDAIALYALVAYARSSGVHVAVVSQDKDFQLACSHHNELLYFGSMPALTEALLGEEARIAQLKTLLEGNVDLLFDVIKDEFRELGFYPSEDPSGDVEDVAPDRIHIDDIYAIGFGECEATVAFEAKVAFSAHVSFDDPESYYRDDDDKELYALRRRAGTVKNVASINGVAKIKLNADWSKIEEIVQLVIETGDIAVDGYPDTEPDDSYDW